MGFLMNMSFLGPWCFAFVVVPLFAGPQLATAQEWGAVKGRIVFSGEPPAMEKLEITRDEEVCGRLGLVDESVVVNKQNAGLRNVVIWLSSKDKVPVHPDRIDSSKPVTLDNDECRFVPRIVALRTNQVLQCTNSDSVAHNVAVYARRNQPFSIVVPQDKPLEHSFPRDELLPIRVDCSIHAWMRAYLVITEHPYVAVTNASGEFRIPDVPYGRWQFRFWHEKPGNLSRFYVADKEPVELQRGAWEIQVNGEEIDLGQLTVDGTEFTQTK